MQAIVIVKIGIGWLLFCSLGVMSLADPVVSNVRAQQRSGTGLVDIYYDLSGTVGPGGVSVSVSDDSGATYDVAVSSLSGDVGVGIASGTDRHIVWDALADAPGIRSETMRVQLTADSSEAVPMVDVPAGSFAMGDAFSEGDSDELPVHTVTLSAYKMGETEVTWVQWQEVRDWAVSNGYTDLDGIGAGKGEDHPVHSVSWHDVVKWCNAASEKIGLEPVYYLSDGGAVYRTGQFEPFINYSKNGYRLPTEAEWERAARGGLEGKRFPWGDTISHAEANYWANGSAYSYDVSEYNTLTYHPNYDGGGTPYTSPVGSFAANGLGLYDMTGNVWEWCGDCFEISYYGSSPSADPAGPEGGCFARVLRGGNCRADADHCRVAYRTGAPSYRDVDFGFRVSRSQSLLRSGSFGGQALQRSESYVEQALVGSLSQTVMEAQNVAESADFSLNTVTWMVSGGPFTGGSVTGLGIYLETTTATLTGVPDPGYVFGSWESSLLNTLVDVPLEASSAVSLVDYGGDGYYALNGISSYIPMRRYVVEAGSYILVGVPEDAALAILNAGKESTISYAVDNSTPIDIYVSGASLSAPFYEFADDQGNDLTALFSSGYALMRGRTYRFIADGISASHPFMINSSRFQTQANWVTGSPLTGTGGMLQVTLPADYEAGVQFYCTVHSTMNGYFNLSILNDGGNLYDAYWGDIEVTVSGDFGSMDVKSFNTNVQGGTGLLVYNNGSFLTANSNPITIFINGNKTVAATFPQDTSDADGDGLTAYQENVLYGTDPGLADTDGDTHSDFVELITFGSDPLDAASVPEYNLLVLGDLYTTSTGLIVLGKINVSTNKGSTVGTELQVPIEINTTVTLTAAPDNGIVFAGWNGAASGAENPVSLTMDGDKTVGAEFVSASNFDRIEQAGFAAGEMAGISQGVLQGVSQGEAAVVADPRAYDLYSLEMINTGLRLGGMRISDATGSKLISFNIESSEDLQTWTLEERVERSLVLPTSGSLFIRVSVPEDVVPEDVVPMVVIPAGSFAMGDAFSEGTSDELPVHTVTLSAYKMGETEVTWVQWQEVRDWAVSNGYTDLDGIGAGKGEDHPVHSVNWYDVVKWCNAASEKVGLEPVYYLSDGGAVYRTGEVSPFINYSKNGYRLPTEAEWERAARGGLEGKRFPWGDTISHAEANYYALPSFYSYDVNSGEGFHPDYDGGADPYTSPVGSFAANGLGLYDMAGNVMEWCGDWYGSSYYGSSPSVDPAGPESGSEWVFRGGSLVHSAYSCRVAGRGSGWPASSGIGFRLSRR